MQITLLLLMIAILILIIVIVMLMHKLALQPLFYRELTRLCQTRKYTKPMMW